MGSNPTPSAIHFQALVFASLEIAVDFHFCTTCMAYKRMHRVSAVGEQLAAGAVALIMFGWLVTRPTVHWTSWVLAAVVLPMTAYFAWPRKSRQRCEGCGTTMHVSEPL